MTPDPARDPESSSAPSEPSSAPSPALNPTFAGVRRAADQIRGTQLPVLPTTAASLAKYVPASFTWTDLAALVPPEDEDRPGRVLAIRACLDAEPSRLQSEEGADAEGANANARQTIRHFIGHILAPVVVLGPDDDDVLHGDELADRRTAAMERCRAYAPSGLAVLAHTGLAPAGTALRGTVSTVDGDDAQLLYTLHALADAGQPWTTDAVAARADELVARTLADPAATAAWIADGILARYLRPLFARHPAGKDGLKTDPAVTNTAGGGIDAGRSEAPRAKAWKYLDARAVPVFAWALAHATPTLLKTSWPLCVPVLLALAEDGDTPTRARGLRLVEAFVRRAPQTGVTEHDAQTLVQATGLDRVLADCIVPTLLFLPRLTPEAESLQLLAPAYGALLAIATTRREPDLALLDRVLRDGVYTGFFHAREHMRIAEELARQAGRVVQAMGVHATKHLKDLLPLYSAILTDPFAMRHVPGVAAANDALRTTIASCWPRLAHTPWQSAVLEMLMLCWLNADDDRSQDRQKRHALQAQLETTAAAQLAVMRAAGIDVAAAVQPLIETEPRLAQLFNISIR